MNEGAINLYIDNPTRGMTDGTNAAESHQIYPITAIVNTKTANYAIVKAALRCDAGFRTTGITEVSFKGSTASKWQIANDDNYLSPENAAAEGDFQASLELDSVIGDTNHVIWLKALTNGNEPAQVDTNALIHVYGRTVPA